MKVDKSICRIRRKSTYYVLEKLNSDGLIRQWTLNPMRIAKILENLERDELIKNNVATISNEKVANSTRESQ